MRSYVDVHKAGFSPVAACIQDQIRSAYTRLYPSARFFCALLRPVSLRLHHQRVCICRPRRRRLCGRGLGRRDARRERSLFHSPTTGIRSHGGNANGTGQCRVQIDQVRSNPVHVVLHYKRASGDRFPLLSRLDLKRRRGYVTHVTYVRRRQSKQFGVFYGKRHTRRFGA